MAAERKAVVKNADMSEDMQQDAVDCATQALEKFNIEKVRFFPVQVCRCSALCSLFAASLAPPPFSNNHAPLFCSQDIAAYIKKEFDKKYNPTWHCIVGRNFGSYVTHETKHFIYFYLGQVAILLFKSG